jgi:FkbM family methyltransferase
MKKPSRGLWFLLEKIGIKNQLDLEIAKRYWHHPYFVKKMLALSKAQLKQDVFVACELKQWKKNSSRYFVEFGATNGIDLSNTYLLEKEFGWSGLLIEPGKTWQTELVKNRNCLIDFRCVASESGLSVLFNETSIPELSTMNDFSNSDSHSEARTHGSKYEVTTVSLDSLLEEYGCPDEIDYLSIDTEGSEYSILQKFNFKKWSFKVITVEHNFTEMRESIFNLLTKNGYRRVLYDLNSWDDWYVKK